MSLPIEQIDDYRWRIPVGSKPGMKVPAIIFASRPLLDLIRNDLSPDQPEGLAADPPREWSYEPLLGDLPVPDPLIV